MEEKNNEIKETENDNVKEPLVRRAIGEIIDWAEIFVVAAASVILIFTFIARLTIVNGPSMEDTLHSNDFLIVSDMFYKLEPGDIVVCHDISTGYTDPIVKRVIAVGGQTVDIDFDTWTVTVDGEVIDEPYAKFTTDQIVTSNLTYPFYVEEGSIFVMGDNRNHSADSRDRAIGAIDERSVVGKAVVRILPFDRFTIFD